jgi:acetate---CoA ligase (ADP-forming)
MSLQKIFEPNSIAVIGASNEVESVGYTIFQNLIASSAKVFPVNPKHELIGGQKSYKSILDIMESIDLAIVIVPAKFCLSVMTEIAETNCKSVIMISAGFKEIGEEGAEIEKGIIDLCQKNSISLIGPNCLGVLNPWLGLNASFSASIPPKGNIALVSQSGAICTAIIDSAEHLGLGFSKFVSTGNKAVVGESEIIEYLNHDSETKVIAIYLESLVNAKLFIETCRSSTKPIIVLKAGKSTAGAKSASSHTGALASDQNLFKALFRQAGVIEVNSVEEMFEVMQVLSHNPLTDVKNIAIITNAGGPGVLATDAAVFNNLNLSHFNVAITNQLKEVLPPTANFHNPIDLIGDATCIRYKAVLDIIITDSDVDAIVVIVTPQSMTDITNIGQIILDTKNKYAKPIVVSLIGFQKTNIAADFLRQNKIAAIDFPENAIRALSKIRKFDLQQHDMTENPFKGCHKVAGYETYQIKEIISNSKKNNQKFIPENEAKDILKIYNFPVVKSYLAKNEKEAGDFAAELNSKVVLKVISQDIFHKTEVGGVLTNLKPDEVPKAYNQILDNVKKLAPNATIDGILVSEHVEFSMQNQFVLGVKKDPNLGHAIMFGLGGIFVEIFKDTTFGFVPLDEVEINRMIDELKSKAFLFGFRGMPPLDIQELKKSILNLAQLVTDFPEITEIDMNPIVMLANEVKILDIKIVLE